MTDQDLKKSTSVTDALGRVTRVIEDPQGLAYQTNYTYDALDNLRKVDQAGQSRYFIYDSLGRLLRAKNTEQGVFNADADFPAMTDPISGNSQWSLGYAYDAVGNPAKRKDARNITIVYQYDNLNRVKTVDYSNTTPNPDVKRVYDGATDGRGMPWKRETTGASLSTVTSYDAAGRPKAQDQQFWNGTAWSTPFNVQYEYHLAGSIKKVTYPSGRSVSYTYDTAARPASVSGNLGDGTQRTYADQIRYHETGGMEQERFGTDHTGFQ